MPFKQAITDQCGPVKVLTDDVDDRSKEQLANFVSLPFINHHVTAMPDVHGQANRWCHLPKVLT